MLRGRKPKASRIKELTGNPGKRRINKREPKHRKDIGPPPGWLDDVAKQEWERIAPELRRTGILTVVDRTALAAYCKAYSRWRQAEDIVERSQTLVFKTKSGYIQQLPHISIAQTYLKIVNALAAEFGLTPSSRTRLSIGDAPSDDEDAEFFGERPAKAITKDNLAQIRPQASA